MKTRSLFIGALFLFAVAYSSRAASPTDEVKTTTDHIIVILKDPNLHGDAHKAERRQKLRQELDQRFDWTGLARGCLGRHWQKRSRAEQTEFAGVFSEFLERTYLDKFETYYDDLDKIDYLGQKIIENYGSVKVLITTKEKIDHPVEYRLQKSAATNEWRIYDVIVEGVSLVKNYRDQFDEIISKSSYASLIKDLKEKLRTPQQ